MNKDFDFDDWASLARDDPQAFEQLRLWLIDDLINAAPPHLQKRLAGLQWRIDCLRRRSQNPLGACLRISSMMWDSVLGERELVASLRQLSQLGSENQGPEPTAAVLPFRKDLELPSD